MKSPRDREARRQQSLIERSAHHIADTYNMPVESGRNIVKRVIVDLWDCSGEMLQAGNIELLAGGNERDIWKAMLNRALADA